MASIELTGRCLRCGVPATNVWHSRFALKPLELCDAHTVEHRDAIKGEWTKAE